MDDKNTSRGIGRDMSPEAIEGRLRIVSNLRVLCRELAESKKRKLQQPSASAVPILPRVQRTTGVKK